MFYLIASVCLAALPLRPLVSAPPREPASAAWTLMIYGAADNNADGPILGFLQDIRENYQDDPQFQIVMFIDRSEQFSADASVLGEDFTGGRIYRVNAETVERLAGGDEFPEIRRDAEYEPNSADPENLRKFIRFTKANFPSERYGLLIYGHANGQDMCPDEESDAIMGIAELTSVVGEDEAVDFTALELCNMGGIEIAYQWRPGNGGFFTETLVAIPNAGPPLDWGRAFARIRSPGADGTLQDGCFDPAALSAADFGRLIVEEGGRGREEAARRHPEEAGRIAFEAVASYDLWAAEDVKVNLDALTVALVAHDAKEAFEAIRGPGPRGLTMNYVRDQVEEMPYFDLYDLCRRTAEQEDLAAEIRERARDVGEAVDTLVSASFAMPGLRGFEPGKNGVFVVFPDGDAAIGPALLRETVWSKHTWYTPGEPVGPAKGRAFGCWDWCKDGARPGNGEVENWFEMLDCWFDDPAAGPGGWNGYDW